VSRLTFPLFETDRSSRPSTMPAAILHAFDALQMNGCRKAYSFGTPGAREPARTGKCLPWTAEFNTSCEFDPSSRRSELEKSCRHDDLALTRGAADMCHACESDVPRDRRQPRQGKQWSGVARASDVDRPQDEQFFVIVHTATRTERNLPMTITRKQDPTATELASKPSTAKPSGSEQRRRLFSRAAKAPARSRCYPAWFYMSKRADFLLGLLAIHIVTNESPKN